MDRNDKRIWKVARELAADIEANYYMSKEQRTQLECLLVDAYFEALCREVFGARDAAIEAARRNGWLDEAFARNSV